jgi:hypothetical protein
LVYAGTPQIDAPSLYGLANTRTESYDSAEVSVRGNFGPEYSWLASYTRSSTRSNAVLNPMPDDYFVAPNNIGPLSWDTPNRVILWAYLPTFRKKWAWATLLDYRTGFPFSAANNAGTIVGPVDSYRFPAYLEWNVDLERRLRFHGQMWALRIGLNNITDHFNPDSVNGTVESSQFMQFYGGQRRALVFRTRWLGRQ